MLSKSIRMLLLLGACQAVAYAKDITFSGTVSTPLHPTAKRGLLAQANSPRITLLRFNLNEQGKQTLIRRHHQSAIRQHDEEYDLPSAYQLGMNSVPVLDQGMHGSCVTFAVTAAVDAQLNRIDTENYSNDYISQLCQLQLGSYLEHNSYGVSGWEGSFAPLVFNQMTQFGIVNKMHERAEGCGGVHAYPVDDFDTPKKSMNLEAFHKLSERIDGDVGLKTLLDFNFLSDMDNTEAVLNQMKQALVFNNRVVIGVFLPTFDEEGTVGAVGQHQQKDDTWVLTPQIMRILSLDSVSIMGGHEMVVTGYDDEAVAVDHQGRSHKGLLTLRNSWGESVGNEGNFYMSYDYFTTLVIEANEIKSMQPF